MICGKCEGTAHRDDAMNKRCDGCERLVRLCECEPDPGWTAMDEAYGRKVKVWTKNNLPPHQMFETTVYLDKKIGDNLYTGDAKHYNKRMYVTIDDDGIYREVVFNGRMASD